VKANREAVDAVLRYHHEQGLTNRRLTCEDIFAPSLLDTRPALRRALLVHRQAFGIFSGRPRGQLHATFFPAKRYSRIPTVKITLTT
jgi:hypothetical protein